MTWYVVPTTAEMEHCSALPERYGRQSQEEVVGLLPALTYRSASPVPPLMDTTTLPELVTVKV
ncbi:Uncharacterised protein [Vibrio cholerae]|nr:Uncharacterised protein [Vibrio cholerae]CSB72903.1 Uncharacterised protein [Vibrio cholerae]CSD29361.1 Uncharacterised protein [Vibrio cholerae]